MACISVDSFKLYDRATHVYSEAQRVLSFKDVCEEEPADAAKVLVQLMSDSHASCRDLYQCSHPQLDQLVDLCMYVLSCIYSLTLSMPYTDIHVSGLPWTNKLVIKEQSTSRSAGESC